MKFKSLYIQNLGVYREEHIDLQVARSNVAFINGNNGRGKTTLINSLKWCLFKGARPPISKRAIADLGVKGPLEVRVEIEIEGADGTTLLIEKSQLVSVADDLRTETPVGQPILAGKLRKHGEPTVDLQNAAMFVEEWFPKRLENFILFDAEQLANFFNPETRNAIETAVLQIAGVEALDLTIEGLQEQLKKYDREIAKAGGKKAEGLQKELESAEELLAAAQSALEQGQIDQNDAESDLRNILRQLSKYEAAMEHLEKVEGLREKKDNLEEQLKSDSRRLDEALIRNAYLFLLGTTLDAVDTNYEKGLEAGYPLAFPTESLREILDSGDCVCGCDIEQSGHKKNILDLLRQQAVAEGVDKALPQTKSAALGLRTTISSQQAALTSMNSALTSAHRELGSVTTELSGIEGSVADSDEWDSLLDKERRAEAKKRSAAKTIDTARNDEIKLGALVKKLRAELNGQVVLNKETSKLNKISLFLNQCIEIARNTRLVAIENVRSALEDSMNTQYSNIKSGGYRISISERFDVTLVNHDTQSVSEGEKMSLAYSFAIAIRQTLAMQFPLVVDSAFGRLDSANRGWLAEALVGMTLEDSSRQAIFLMHDLEYTPDTARAFSVASPVELYLHHDEESNVTTVKEGTDPDWLSSKTSPWSKKGDNFTNDQ